MKKFITLNAEGAKDFIQEITIPINKICMITDYSILFFDSSTNNSRTIKTVNKVITIEPDIVNINNFLKLKSLKYSKIIVNLNMISYIVQTGENISSIYFQNNTMPIHVIGKPSLLRINSRYD